jgi:hypothetical protein
MTLPIEAIDAAVIDDQWLLTVLAESIRKYDLSDISLRMDEFRRNESAETVGEPDFKEAPAKTWSASQLALV